MTRAYSRNPAVHRELDARLSGGPQRGDDVDKLEAAARKRLGARGWPEQAQPRRDGKWTKADSDAIADALYAIGAHLDTVHAARAGRVTIGAQRILRYPGTRSDEQIARVHEREDAIARRAARARKEAAPDLPTGGGTVANQRARAAQAARFALAHAGRRYSQAADRWNPIASDASPVTGRMWSVADCSSFATWVVWHAVGRKGPDIVNGAEWKAGYTGTMRVHGRRVDSDGPFHPGDCAIYGGGTGKHVVVCYRAGDARTARWASHGSPGGPYDVELHYRGDLSEVRRYIGY